MVATTTVFRVIQRDVGMLQELLCIRAVFRIHADSNTRGGEHGHTVEVERHYQGAANSIRDRVNYLRIGQRARHDDELVTAHPYHNVVGGDGGAQTVRDCRQQLVAGRVSK